MNRKLAEKVAHARVLTEAIGDTLAPSAAAAKRRCRHGAGRQDQGFRPEIALCSKAGNPRRNGSKHQGVISMGSPDVTVAPR